MFRHCTTDEKGKFVIPDLPEGAFDISLIIYPRGGIIKTRVGKQIKDVPTGSEDLVFRFSAFGSISGKVIDIITQQPVTKFEMSINDMNQTPPVSIWLVFESEDGVFTIDDLPPGIYDLKLIAEDYEVKTLKNIIVKENEVTENILIQLGPGCVISGRLLDESKSEPVENAEIMLRELNVTNRPPTSSDTTDEDGIFYFGPVGAGKYMLEILHMDYPSKTIKPIVVGDKDEMDLGDIYLPVEEDVQ